MLWENSDRVPCAFKKVPYENHAEQCRADAELAALRDAEGLQHIVQCYAAFDHREPALPLHCHGVSLPHHLITSFCGLSDVCLMIVCVTLCVTLA